MAKVTVNCDGILCQEQVVFELPEGWIGEVETGEGHWVYCPKCAKLEKPFFEAQCPGCVSSFPDCGLGEAFLYDSAAKRRQMTPDTLRVIGQGICPFRVNGSLGVNVRDGKIQFNNMDLSDVAPLESAEVIVQRINEYIERYPTKNS